MKPLLFVLTLGLLLTQTPTLSPFCVHAQALQVQLAAAQEEGNPDHVKPPDDWFCTPKGMIKNGQRTSDRPCRCHPVATKESSCEERTEDRACLHWCFRSSCGCPSKECR